MECDINLKPLLDVEDTLYLIDFKNLGQAMYGFLYNVMDRDSFVTMLFF